jgi:hypothetical protein
MNEAPEVKLARIEEKLDSLCRSVDMLRGSINSDISEVWDEMKSMNARLFALEAIEQQRKGGKAVLATTMTVAGMIGGTAVHFLMRIC